MANISNKNIDEIPFEKVSSGRLVPWIVASMVYLIILALGTSAYIGAFITKFQEGLTRGFTVELMNPQQGLGQQRTPKSVTLERQRHALEVLSQYPGIKVAEPVGASYLEGLVPPWEIASKDPLFSKPTMINVEPHAGAHVDLKALQKYLHTHLPGAVVFESHPWREQLMKMAWTTLTITLSFAGLICIVAMATLAFVTHSGLLIHERIIHILRLIGATNRYISKRFEAYALSVAMRGSLWGSFFAAITFWLVLGPPHLTHLDNTIGAWGVLLLSPILMGLLTLVCARASVSWALAKEPTRCL